MRRLLDAAPVLEALAFCAGLLLYGSGRGFDLTDEVFYLIWARDPQAYQLTYQPFGHILHPLFRAVGFDLQAYRLAGFAIAALAGAFLGQTLAPAPGQRPRFSLYGALAALTLFFPWIVTPSYNACANVGALLILGGVFAALRPTQLGRVAAVLAGGTGLALAAYGKPPLFAIAVVVMLLTAVVSRNARVAMLSALLLGAVLIFGILAPAELVALVGRISTSQHVLALPNTPLALPAKVVRDALAAPWTLIGAAGAAALGLALPRSRATSWLSSAAIALSLAYVPRPPRT